MAIRARGRAGKRGKERPAAIVPQAGGPVDAKSAPKVRLIGIGASAGGLEALERFFDAMPTDSGVAFAIVQHLSPDFRSMMDELLARHSLMNIRHAADCMEIEPNTLYLNPPRQNLVIASGRLSLVPPDPRDLPNHPIDSFFASLAADQGAYAIGIVLSGTGSDGTRGAERIREAGGTVLVQDPESAKFENMPRSVILKGAASAIGRPDELPILIGQVIRGEAVGLEAPLDEVPLPPETDVLRQLERRFGTNFSYYKAGTVGRRLNRRVALTGANSLEDYARRLREEPDELERLYADLLIGVTAFFRDVAAFTSLEALAIPHLCEIMSASRQLRVWVPGCATGEEAYSIAILICEFARKNERPLNLKIFATDLHAASLETAAGGTFSRRSLAEMPDAIRERYFDADGDVFHAKPALRRHIVFSPHNLIKDPPLTRMDLVSCRNLLIYLDDVAQSKVMALFHFALQKDGILFLGPSEVLGEIASEFQVLDGRWRIFRKIRDVQLRGATRLLPLVAGGAERPHRQQPRPNERSRAVPSVGTRNDRRFMLKAYDTILQRFAPASLLVNRAGDLVHVFGDAQRYLRLRTGLFSQRLADVIIEPLRLAATACTDAARYAHIDPIAYEVSYVSEAGQPVTARLQVEALGDAGNETDYLLIQITEPTRPAPRMTKAEEVPVVRLEESASMQERFVELERNLHFTEESLQTTIEELETSNEELQSTNEELMSANEELQSTNEELHAVNEELYSVSTEHRRKIDELTQLTNDMDNLLKCTEVGTIFLDNERRLRRFTPSVNRAFNLLERDLARPIDHVTARFAYPGLVEDLEEVTRSGRMIEHTFDIGGETTLLRIFPFMVAERCEGTVITLIDVTRLKQTQDDLYRARQTQDDLSKANESLEQFTYIVSHDLRAPLRTILNSAKWIMEDLGETSTPEVREHCQRLMTYSTRITDMLTSLLDYTRLGTTEAPVETIALGPLVDAIVDAIDADRRATVTWAKGPGDIVARRAPLQLVLQNLIDNAIKHSDRDEVQITASFELTPTFYRLTISDDGPGIPKRHHEKIFLPFRKLEHTGNKPGTGMGLALVRKAVADNGGHIEARSDAPAARGTSFVFTWARPAP